MKKYMNAESGFALTVSAVLLLVWGLFPHGIMDRAAEFGQGLMHLEEAGHQVAYFSLKNLSGAGISILIGILVYAFIIRGPLMEKTASGQYVYRNRWPSWMDMEELIYRPVLLGFLPFVSRVVCRVFDSMTDLIVVLLRKTIYRDSPLPYELPEGNAFTYTAGRLMNGCQKMRNRLLHRDGREDRDFIHFFAVKAEELGESNRIIQRSLSFGLMLFGIGLCLTLIYLIFW